MDECLFASAFAALPVGGKTAPRRKLRAVWKWSGNGLVFRERGFMTRSQHSSSPGAEPKSVQNRSGFGGGGFLIFEIGSAGGAEPALSRR